MIKKLAPLFATLCLLSGATVVQAGDTDIIGAPGIIPHPIESYLPITAERDSCHVPQERRGQGPQGG